MFGFAKIAVRSTFIVPTSEKFGEAEKSQNVKAEGATERNRSFVNCCRK